MCKCVLYWCHRVSTQLQLTNISKYLNFLRRKNHFGYEPRSVVIGFNTADTNHFFTLVMNQDLLSLGSILQKRATFSLWLWTKICCHWVQYCRYEPLSHSGYEPRSVVIGSILQKRTTFSLGLWTKICCHWVQYCRYEPLSHSGYEPRSVVTGFNTADTNHFLILVMNQDLLSLGSILQIEPLSHSGYEPRFVVIGFSTADTNHFLGIFYLFVFCWYFVTEIKSNHFTHTISSFTKLSTRYYAYKSFTCH